MLTVCLSCWTVGNRSSSVVLDMKRHWAGARWLLIMRAAKQYTQLLYGSLTECSHKIHHGTAHSVQGYFTWVRSASRCRQVRLRSLALPTLCDRNADDIGTKQLKPILY